MEKNTLQQKLQIAKDRFLLGVKVCNYKIGSVGIVSDEPFIDVKSNKIFIVVTYEEREFYEDVDYLFLVNSVKKGVKRHS